LGFSAAGRHSVAFTDQWGQLFTYFVFFFFGTVVAGYLGGANATGHLGPT
jgi:sodium/hydrogen antiporter